MGRPALNDEAFITEIAVTLVANPEISFAEAFRRVHNKPATKMEGNSQEAIRRRAQRKFTADRAYWISEAEQILAERRREQLQKSYEDLSHTMAEFNRRLEVSGVTTILRSHAQAVQRMLDQPHMKELMEQARIAAEAFQSGRDYPSLNRSTDLGQRTIDGVSENWY